MINWLDRLFNENKLVRRSVLAWAMIMGTIVILRTSADISLITAAVSAYITTVLGLLTVPIQYYFKTRRKEESE